MPTGIKHYRVIRKATPKELAAIHPEFEWADHMNQMVGRTGIFVGEGYPGKTAWIDFTGGTRLEGNAWYPYCVLKEVEV